MPARPLDDGGIERSERPNAGVLHDVLRVGSIAGEPTGEAIFVVETGKHHLGETLAPNSPVRAPPNLTARRRSCPSYADGARRNRRIRRACRT